MDDMPEDALQRAEPILTGFFLVPGFALLSYASAIEPLRAANRLSGRELYRWAHISLDGISEDASSGACVSCTHRPGDDIPLRRLFVCAGGNPAAFNDPAAFAWLRALARRGVQIGGISGGPYILARAGLLNGYRFTIHWEHMPALAEDFPALQPAPSLFVIDRDRLTAAGGFAAFDMMHALIEADHGHALASAVAEWFLHTHVRGGGGPQRMGLRERFNITNAGLLRAIENMEVHIEEPLSRAEIANLAGLSLRQLDRLFETQLGETISAYYNRIRLERARTLLRQTALPVFDIAVACGFASASQFSRAFSRAFRHPPKDERLPLARKRNGAKT
jgi:transcriptional regulator GlxA family with amidase domain